MNRLLVAFVAAISFGAVGVPPIFAQGVERTEAIASSDILSQISMFNYREGPKSDIKFRPTPIATNGEGEAEIEYEDGNARIAVRVDNLPAPTSLGPYTTYVLWALTPDGRAANQGVLTSFEGGEGELSTSYGGSQFALIVTAEPHFAVSAPSMMVALYNVAEDVEGRESRVTTLAERAQYTNLAPIAVDDDNPVDVVQARYAVAIAQAAGAERFAPQPYNAAKQRLVAAETALAGGRQERKTAADAAREAVIAGEDARRSAMLASAEAAADAERASAAAAATAAERARSDLAAAAAAEEASRTTAAAAAEASRTAQAQAREDLRRRLEAALPTRETERGLVSEISGLQFATGTADLNAAAQLALSRFAGIVASYPTLSFNVEGHTDNTGSAATNAELSLRRAEAVRTFLMTQGIEASRIEVEGFGPSQPMADNSTSEGRARNRRVEIVLSGGPLALSAL